MDISFDPAKNARNIALRGISFARAADFDWSLALVSEDLRRDYGEPRYTALGLLTGRLHMLVFTPREGRAHVIVFERPTRERYDFMPRKPRKRAARTGPDNPFLTEADFRRVRPAREVLPEIFGKAIAKKMLRPRGRPKTGTARTSISLRLPPEILARWKATGPGWQTRMVERLAKAK